MKIAAIGSEEEVKKDVSLQAEAEYHQNIECPILIESIATEVRMDPLQQARHLLLSGVPTLLLPSPRRWMQEAQVVLPTGSLWPPIGYSTMERNTLLLLFEEQALLLARRERFPVDSRRELFDRFTMLMLPGMECPSVENLVQHGRDLLSASVREVAAGKTPISSSSAALIQTLWSVPKDVGQVDEIVRCLADVPLLLE